MDRRGGLLVSSCHKSSPKEGRANLGAGWCLMTILSKRMVHLIALIAVLHFVLSYVAMNIIMGLKFHNPIDFTESLRINVASGLEWIFFFPSTLLSKFVGFHPDSVFVLLTVNTLCWCLTILPIPIAIMIWKRRR
jgi:hypothetical protein